MEWDNSQPPPPDGSKLYPRTLVRIEDIGEVLGRDKDGNLRSYNQYWDATHGADRAWPKDGELLPEGVKPPEGAELAPGVKPPAQYTVLEGAFKESVIDWGGNGTQARANGVVHLGGSQEQVLTAFRQHYKIPLHNPIYFDRIGWPGGDYLGLIGPDGPASFGARGLDATSIHKPYFSYQLIEDNIPPGYTIRSGIVAPAQGGPGGAIQLLVFDKNGTRLSVRELIDQELLLEVSS